MPEGTFSKRPEDSIPHGERRSPIKHADNLHPEGNFTQRPEQAVPHGERRSPIKHADNLHPEGKFYSPVRDDAPKKGERAPVKIPVDNLKPSKDKFYEKPKETAGPGERRTPLKQVDNLHMEGIFYF